MTEHVNDEDDAALLVASAAGDGSAFERLYRRHAAKLHGLAARMLGRVDLAEDAVQETFLSAFRNASRFRGESKLTTWFASIALNHCRMILRKRTRRTLPLEAAAAVAAPERSQDEGTLRAALDEIDPAAKELLLLAAQGHSYDALGAILELSADQVRGRLHRARKVLLEVLERREGGRGIS